MGRLTQKHIEELLATFGMVVCLLCFFVVFWATVLG